MELRCFSVPSPLLMEPPGVLYCLQQKKGVISRDTLLAGVGKKVLRGVTKKGAQAVDTLFPASGKNSRFRRYCRWNFGGGAKVFPIG